MTIEVKAPSLEFKLTPKIVAAVAHEEGIVLEAYKDSRNIWTWALGVAETGGHDVLKYKDKPSTIEEAISKSIEAMKEGYLKDVQEAFNGCRLKEHEIAGALTFHWNTGKIEKASWVNLWKDGKISEARASYMEWRNPPEIIPRRTRDAALFFDAKWPEDMRAPLFSVSKPSYKPFKPKPIEILPIVQKIMGMK